MTGNPSCCQNDRRLLSFLELNVGSDFCGCVVNRLLFGHCLEIFWCCLLLIGELRNCKDVVHSYGDFMVIIGDIACC